MIALITMAWASAEADFAAANSALANGDLAAAEQGYRALLDAGYTDGDLYYDLGNVLWREKQVAGAILAWRRAEVRLPRDPDVQANLDFARRVVRDPLETVDPAPWFAPWQVALTPDEAQWIGFGLAGLGLLAIALRRRWEQAPLAGVGGVLAGVGALVATGGIVDASLPPVAVVLSPEVTATSDLGGGVDLFTLHAGAETLAIEREAGRTLLQLPDGRKGWVADEHVGVAAPGAPFPVL